jgi:hypothetical protein
MQHHMADRYQNRAYSANDGADRNHQTGPQGEGDPLAELARLIGQTDPNANYGRTAPSAPEQNPQRAHFRPAAPAPAPEAFDDDLDVPEQTPAGPPPWMLTRATPQSAQPTYQGDLHPVRRFATAQPAQPQSYDELPLDHRQQPRDLAESERYDDALYGSADSAPGYSAQDSQSHGGYYDDSYAYQEDDGYESREAPERPRRGGLTTVIAVLALAVVGTGAAFGYRTYVGSPRSGEPPIIKADAGPNKVVPPSASADNAGKQMDRLAAGTAPEQIVSREEQPVDVKDIAKSGPRVVFPPLNQNANPPSTASVSPNNRLPANAANGTIAGSEPRKIKTFTIKPDQPDAAAKPAVAARPAAPAAAPSTTATTRAIAPVASTPASNGTAPLSLAPQAGADTRTHVASTNPVQPAPSASGGYVVQISSQRSEADARASFKALQSKFPSSLSSRSPLIKRADLGSRGVYYRAMVGPFASSEEASHFCGGLKASGGQCVVQRN